MQFIDPTTENNDTGQMINLEEMFREERDVDNQTARGEDNIQSDRDSADEDYIPKNVQDKMSGCNFHSDSSNMDNTNEEVCYHKSERQIRARKN